MFAAVQLCADFADLGLQAEGDAGTHFRLRFSYNTLTVDSNEFNVKPNHVFVSVHPSDGQYGSGATKADIGGGITVQARDGGNNVLTGADNTNAGTDTDSSLPIRRMSMNCAEAATRVVVLRCRFSF